MSDVLSQNEINELLKSLMDSKESEIAPECFKQAKK
jgi:flagellar motor switch protein FliM